MQAILQKGADESVNREDKMAATVRAHKTNKKEAQVSSLFAFVIRHFFFYVSDSRSGHRLGQ